jgi:hypothetical protein
MKRLVKISLVVGVVLIVFAGNSVAGTYSGGSGTEADPYQIGTAEDIIEMSGIPDDWDDCFVMIADVDMSGYTFTTAVIAADTYDGNSEFDGTSFTGVFEGAGYAVLNLTIETVGEWNEYLGLFGEISGEQARVTNLGLEEVSIIAGNCTEFLGDLCGSNAGAINNCYSTGSSSIGYYYSEYLGGLCGMNAGTISNCFSMSSVSGGAYTWYLGGLCGRNYGTIVDSYATGSASGGNHSQYIGGLCGWNENGTINNCSSTGLVTGEDFIGGLCGWNKNGTISNCSSTGSVTGEDFMGGLCGWNEGGTISKGCSTGSVTGNNYLGGLCAGNDGTISDCYANGTVSGDDSLGGLCGINEYGCIIVNCYATGSVTGGDAGGLCADSYYGTIINCFWDIDTSGQNTSEGGTGLPTEDMQQIATFTGAGWDFVGEDVNGTDDIWRMCVDGIDYPRLSHEYSINGDFTCPDGVDLTDFSFLSEDWQIDGLGSYEQPDLTGDGVINIDDIIIFVEQWLGG